MILRNSPRVCSLGSKRSAMQRPTSAALLRSASAPTAERDLSHQVRPSHLRPLRAGGRHTLLPDKTQLETIPTVLTASHHCELKIVLRVGRMPAAYAVGVHLLYNI